MRALLYYQIAYRLDGRHLVDEEWLYRVFDVFSEVLYYASKLYRVSVRREQKFGRWSFRRRTTIGIEMEGYSKPLVDVEESVHIGCWCTKSVRVEREFNVHFHRENIERLLHELQNCGSKEIERASRQLLDLLNNVRYAVSWKTKQLGEVLKLVEAPTYIICIEKLSFSRKEVEKVCREVTKDVYEKFKKLFDGSEFCSRELDGAIGLLTYRYKTTYMYDIDIDDLVEKLVKLVEKS